MALLLAGCGLPAWVVPAWVLPVGPGALAATDLPAAPDLTAWVGDDDAGPAAAGIADRDAGADRDTGDGDTLIAGLIFVASPEALTDTPPAVARGRVTLSDLPFLDHRFMAEAGQAIGQPLTLDRLDELAMLAANHATDAGRPVVDAYVPAGQDITSGIIQIVVAVAAVGRVTPEGNSYFSDARLIDMLGFEPGDPVRDDLLRARLNRINRNRFRDVDAIYTAGAEPGTTDIILRTKDRIPIRPFATVDNAGTRLVDPLRVSAGVVWGDVFWTDTEFTYQYVRAPDGQAFQGHAASFRMDLGDRSTLTASGGYSRARIKVDGFTVRGRSIQGKLRYEEILPDLTWAPALNHSVSIEANFSRSDSDVAQFDGTNQFDTDIDVIQFSASYSASHSDSWGTTAGGVQWVLAPGNLTPGNQNIVFEEARSGSTADYTLLRGNLERTIDLPYGFTVSGDASGQVSGHLLQAIDRFAIGGAGSVRGYGTSVFTGDSGYRLSIEAETPRTRLIGLLDDAVQDELSLVAFYDHAHAELNQPSSTQTGKQVLDAVGYGLRYTLSPYLAVQIDHGWPLRSRRGTGGSDGSRMHFSIAVGY